MIFLILGTQKFQFNRLLQAIDQLIETEALTESVFAQIGNSDYRPKHYKFEKFLNKKDFIINIKKASVVITHSGVGSIISAIQLGIPTIVCPRLSKYNEHVDDHQLDIAKAFQKQNFVLCCYETEDLIKLINEANTHVFEKYKSHNNVIVDIIQNFLNSIA